ncbi:hypothetical protein N0V83_011002 [Neocucurbitaria cava]|uniref:Uncharacterized protein n=1 Tax=Neocucurbitaria cava TaxID=798079 RepID=A0A9W8XZ75_9PLEO|nr:hypothetical protein N0V83_011002 [Neocucurbitaria cava]
MVFFPLCLLSLFIACALADLEYPTYITVPSTVEAGSPFNATINVQWHGLADSSYAYAFRIYLGSSYEDKQFYFYDPECYLIHEQSLCDPTINIYSDYIDLDDTPITVTIPPSVGPAGAHYVLIGRILNTDGSYYGSTWESDVFDLTGANGTWANYQRTGYTMWAYCCADTTHGVSKFAVKYNDTKRRHNKYYEELDPHCCRRR